MRGKYNTVIVLILLWLAGFYMRMPILSAAPLAPHIGMDFALSQSALGALTTLPVLMLGLGALPASLLMGRIGARNTLILALLVTAVCSAWRGMAPDIGLLLVATAIMGLGVAAMQPALPALVPRWCPKTIALGSTVYLNGMMLGEFSGAGLTLPAIMPLAEGSWRVAFGLWSIPAVLLIPALLYPRLHGQSRRLDPHRSLPSIRDRHMWLFGLMLGTTSATFFGVNAYMASVLDEKLMGDQLDVVLVAFNLSQVVASLAMVGFSRHILAAPRLLFCTSGLLVLGLLGFMLLPGVPAIMSSILLGFVSALQLIALVTLPPLMRSAREAGKLAAGMFALGYILAFLMPLGSGVIADMTGSTLGALWLLVLFNVICVPQAWRTPLHAATR